MKLIVGLGNPGSKHARNRHNVGFMAVERIAEAHGFGPWRKKFSSLAAEGEIGGHKVLLLKPETFMNDSGRAVAEAARFHKLGEDDVLVIHDEIDLAPAKLKTKTGGGNAGHNGLRSITSHIGNDYGRVRIGVGHPGNKELVHGWVLRDFSKADADWLEPLLDAITEAAGRLAAGEQSRFLTDVARKLQQVEALDDTDTKAAAAPAPEIKQAGRHPAGERQSKRQSALAANLKRWLSGQKKPD
jgi:PTH1 family peptidyl-tRNA hydrolase